MRLVLTGVRVPRMNSIIERWIRYCRHEMLGRDLEKYTYYTQALEAVARALDERRSLVLAQARYDRDTSDNGVVINLTHMVSVRVASTDSATSGQYL